MARKEFKFWLDEKRSEDWQVNSLIDQLKAARQFSRAIRDGLRLIVSLKQHDVSVLLEMFPWMKDKLAPPAPGGGGQELTELKSELAALRTMLTGDTLKMQSAAPAAPGPKPLGGLKPIAAPAFFDDDDQDTLVIKKSTTANSSQNLVLAMQGLQG